MKIPLSWLSEYVDIKGLSSKEISEGLRFSGTENFLEESNPYEKIIIGEIRKIKNHPNADKLKIAEVAISKEQSLDSDQENFLQIVCGAPNIKAGQKVPVALLGATLSELKISKVKIRGIDSSGMLCSEKELGLGNDHSGILILKKSAIIGSPFSDYFNKILRGSKSSTGEAVIDAEITPNRGDCLSIVGIAQEIAAVFGRKLSLPKFKKIKAVSRKEVVVSVLEKKLCPRYIAKVVEGIRVEPSPEWMQKRLLSAGVRPISSVVDVTNYVMLELGQPLHAFDYEKLSATSKQESGEKPPSSKLQIPKIVVRKAKKGEKIITLDGIKRDLAPEDLVIADTKKPIAIAGVMGGRNTEVGEKTKNIILEAAVFDGESVRKTAKRLVCRTEASNRFEKGVPLNLPEIAIERAAELIIDISKNTKNNKQAINVSENFDVLSSWIWIQHVGLRFSRIKKFLGVEISEEKVLKILKSLGFLAEKFDFKKEARKHVGKPYVFGAKYKTHGDLAFDCSYLTDYIYSQIGKFIGYTSLAQYELGKPVEDGDLRPGDILFLKGHIEKSATDHYFVPDGLGGYCKVDLAQPKEVGHNALYIGGGRIVHARHYEYDVKNKKWKKLSVSKAKVAEEDVSVFLESPEYLGARRYVKNPYEFIGVTSPWWRIDIKTEEDLLEEVARIYGYENLPLTLPSGNLPTPKENKELKLIDCIKSTLVSGGFSEVISYSFVPALYIEAKKQNKALKIRNPISVEQEYMRTSLIPSMIEVAFKNQENFEKIKVFEVASVYSDKKEEQRLAILAKLQTKNKAEVFAEAKGIVNTLSATLFNKEFDIEKSGSSDFFEAGESARILFLGSEIGTIGLISEKKSDEFGIKGTLCVAEILLDKLISWYPKEIKYQALPKYPRSVRDINLIFDKKLTANEIIGALKKIKSENLLDFKILDIYESSKKSTESALPSGKKSVTIRLIIGSDIRTLIDAEINKTEEEVLDKLILLGGEPRV